MKVITVGDLHGSPAWKEISPQEWDKIIFLGDYVDSFDYKDDDIAENLQAVIGLKEKFPEKVILLWGNHDLGYLYHERPGHSCSGFRRTMAKQLNEVFTGSRELFLPAWQVDNYLWTHAGITNGWFKAFLEKELKPSDENLAATLNRLFDAYFMPLFHVSRIRGGIHPLAGIFWADSMELLHDPLPQFHQIAGHTKTRNGVLSIFSGDRNTSVTLADCLETKTEFYKLDLA